MRIAYFTNQYPAVTHTFIRREIRALEALEVTIVRYALTSSPGQLVDPEDKAEFERTMHIFEGGSGKLLKSVLRSFVCHPLRTLGVFGAAARMGMCSDRGILRHLAYAAEAIVLAEWCRRDKIEHVHAHFGTNPAIVAMLAARLINIRYSFTAHGPEEFEKALIISLEQKVRNATFAVCVSSFGRSQLMRWSSPDQWDKIALVRCGLDSTFFNTPATPPSPEPRFVCVGRLGVEKAQLILVGAVRLLRDAGVDCKVVLVGDGPMRGEVESAIRRMGLEKQITITGWVSGERVRKELGLARALVLASFSENMPVVIMEAMALGRPVISTYVAGIPELVQPSRNGWLVPAGDEIALADAMQQALSSPVERLGEMGAAGRADVIERHNVMLEAAKLKRLFENHKSTVRSP
jgi:glycosyltransferase involved in cell wall biosynthesis